MAPGELFIQLTKEEGGREAGALKIPDLTSLCQDEGGKKRKMTDRLSYSSTASKKDGERKMFNHPSLLFCMF